MADDIDYSVPGPLTDLAAVSRVALEGIPDEPVDICGPAHSLVIHPNDAESLGLPDDRFAENQIRPAAALIEALLALDSAPLDIPRSPGRAIRDLAALNKVEMLPWDEWGRMGASYQGQTGADYDGLLDTIADVSAADDSSAVAELYASDELRVPEELIA